LTVFRALSTKPQLLLLVAGLLCFGADCRPEKRPIAAPAFSQPVMVTSTAPLAAVPPAELRPAQSLPPEPRRIAYCFECNDGRLKLSDGWRLQASAKLKAKGKELSLPGYADADWYPTSVPSTVLAALVKDGVYPDPYHGNNFSSIPAAPFNGSYWYRTELSVPPPFEGQSTWLNLDGINYKANVWLNGELIAPSKELTGTFSSHELNVTALLRQGQPNALAIEVFPPDLKRDLALSWLDWNPTPADRNMGIWRDVYLKTSGPVAVRGTRVLSKVNLTTLDSAELTLKMELHNTSDRALRAGVEARLTPTSGGDQIPLFILTQDISLAPRETRTIVFDAAHYPDLALKSPRLWWPTQLGEPNLYDLEVRASVEARVSDMQPVRFGIRDVSFEQDATGERVFRINGKRIAIRGGGWASDMLLRNSEARLETEFSLVKDLGLNTIRLEGKLESDEFFAKADAYGLLVLPGWMCCDRWQESKSWSKAEHEIALAAMTTQARRLRNHPSVIDFLIGSDEAPAPDVERELVAELRKQDWPVAISPSASDRTTPLLGKSGFKMTGPYDWVSPFYWYEDHAHGGAFGLNAETSPGPALAEIESLREWLAPDELLSLWSKPKARLLHAGTQGTRFDNLGVFNEALAKRYGKPVSLEDYVQKAQLMTYEGERAMFEAYARNKYSSASGVVQWLLNNSWPSLIWHLYGYDFGTAGGYFGAKKANEPLHIQYSYDDRSIVVVNQTQEPTVGLSAAVRVYDTDSQLRFALDFPVAVAADAATRVMALPEIEHLSPTYFVKVTLLKGAAIVSSNWYWLSHKSEVSDFKRTDWDYTPVTQFSDFTDLARLTPATVKATLLPEQGARVLHVQLRNVSPVIAFFVRLKLTHGNTGAVVLPALWQDNYVSLMPGEKRDIAVDYSLSDAANTAPGVELSGWNVERAVASGG
jgi:exo-1,4-beta-D-glucosaminidase